MKYKSSALLDRFFFTQGLVVLMVLASCSQKPDASKANTSEAYVQQINRWHQERIESLKQEDSWLSLAGLYWLDEGRNTFGSDSSNDIVFPKDKAPGKIGWIELKNGSVNVHVLPELDVRAGGKPITDTTLITDAQGEPTVLSLGPLRWYVIERNNRLGIRLKDTDKPAIKTFKGIDRFPVSARWRIRARFNPFDEPKTVKVPDILGFVSEEPLYGTLKFEIDGETYTLDPLGNPKTDDEFFIIFGDKTNGETTYGGGRFVYVNTPDEDGYTYIDFNKAYNPPCVFNSYATCPLPPAQNKLPVNITAGEKNYKGGTSH